MKIDIHNFKQQEITIRRLLDKSEISNKNKKLILEFVEHLSLTTKIGTARRVKLLSTLKQLSFKIKKDFDKVTNNDLEKIVSKIQSNEDYSVWTISDYNKILKRFYKWLIHRKNLSLNVEWINGSIKEKDIPKLKRNEMITEEEAHKLVETTENARNKAIFSLIWDTGARIGEIGSMTINSVNFEDQGTIVDLSGKTGKRSAFIIESTPFLNNWINLHPFKDDPNAPLWISMNQDPKYKYKPLSYRMYYKLFERAFIKAKIKKKFNPHLFRHSRALWCAQNNWNQVMANKMFGWGISSKMYNYYVSLSTEDVKDKMMECYGISTKRKEKVDNRKPSKCPRCEALNDNKSRFCFKCGLILDMEIAKELMKKKSWKRNYIRNYSRRSQN